MPSAPILPSDNANAYLDTVQSIMAPETQQHNSPIYPLPIPEPNYGYPNPHLFDASSAFDLSTFDSASFDPSVFDPSTFSAPAFDLG